MPCRSCGAETSQGSSKCFACAKKEFYGTSRAETPRDNYVRYKIIAFGSAIALFVILIAFYNLKSSTNDAPSVADIENKMREHLVSTSRCTGQLFFDSFKIVKIGEYKKGDPPFVVNGWPIHIAAELRCQSAGRSVTNSFKGDAPTAYVRKGLLGYEVFIPEVLDSMLNDFQRRIDQAVDRM